MGLVIEIKNIVSPNNFKLFYQNGRTPGSVSEQENPTWGAQYGSVFAGGTSSITIDFDVEVDPNPYGKQYWFKILDTVTNSYIIENIYIHELDFYTKCFTPTPTVTPTYTPICNFSGGSAISNLTPTPTITPTHTPICNFSGGSAVQTNTTPTPTPTITPTFTITPTYTPTITPTGEPTVRLYWSTNNKTGGQLLVTSNGGVEGDLLDELTTSTAKSGYIDILVSNCPYTIKGRWTGGSGNTLQFRICGISVIGEIYTSPIIDNGFNYNSEELYLMDPTPTEASVALHSQVPLSPLLMCSV